MRLALKVVMQNDEDLMEVILLYEEVLKIIPYNFLLKWTGLGVLNEMRS